jgi:predicted dehydrogenase
VFHAPYVSAIPQLDLVWIVQRTGDSAAEAYPGVTLLRSLEELLATDVELVVIGSPSPLHFSMTKQALLAGKHVVCDKPMTTTLAQAEELEQLAKEKGLLLFPFHNRRWDGDFKTLRQLIDDHAVGRVVTLDSHFDRYRPEPKAGAWREEADGGGLLYDIGPHLIDQALTLFGHPTKLSAVVRSDRNVGKVPDAFDINLFFPGGRDKTILVRLGATALAAEPAPRFRLHGTSGSFTKYGLDPQEPTILSGVKVPSLRSSEPWLPEPESAYGTLTFARDTAKPTELERSVIPTIPGDYRSFYLNVAQSILGEAVPEVSARCAIRVARIIGLAQESGRTGSTVTVDATGW